MNSYKCRRFCRVPNSAGMRPVKRFSCRYKYRSAGRFASSLGISPLKLLKLRYLLKYNLISFNQRIYNETATKEKCTFPINITYRCVRLFNSPISGGRISCNLFQRRFLKDRDISVRIT